MTTQDFVKGLDATGTNPLAAADINNMVDLAYPKADATDSTGVGLNITTKDSALNTPVVPDPTADAAHHKWKRYTWFRIPDPTAPDLTPIQYRWNEDIAVSDPTYLKWVQVKQDNSTVLTDIATLTANLATADAKATAATNLANIANATATAANTTATTGIIPWTRVNALLAYALFREEYVAGTAGTVVAANSLNVRSLNTSRNAQTWAVLANNVIQLSAGTYYIEAWGQYNGAQTHQSIIDDNNGNTLLIGSGENGTTGTKSIINGVITANAAMSIRLLTWVTTPGGGSLGTSVNKFGEVFASVGITKLA